MKSICPTCKGPLYLPDNCQSFQKWLVLCPACCAIYQTSPGTVIGAWLRFSHHHQEIYQARIQLKAGSTKTVDLEKLIPLKILVLLVTPQKGLGKLKPMLLIETQTENSHLLIHPRQQLRKYHLYCVIGVLVFVVCLSLSLNGLIGVMLVIAIVSGTAVTTIVSRVYRGREGDFRKRHRLLIEQRLIKQSDHWGKRLQYLEKELSKLHGINQRLMPYDEDMLFRIDSLSKVPRERRYFQDKYYELRKLIECYILAKGLIDMNTPIIQSTEAVPHNLIDQLFEFTQEIETLENRYRKLN